VSRLRQGYHPTWYTFPLREHDNENEDEEEEEDEDETRTKPKPAANSNALDGEGSALKLIIAIIQPSRLEAVKAALTEVEVFRLTVMDVQGFGRQKGHTELYRGHEFTVNLLRKVELQIAVNEDFVEPTINAIIKGGRTGERGEIGDGKIFVLPLEDCIRIRTGERGSEAI